MAKSVLRALTALTLFTTLVGCQPEGSDTNGSRQTLNGCEVEAYQADMLDQVNDARATPRTCGDTDFPAAPALNYQCDLNTAAERHSQDMATNNFHSHTGSDGLKLKDRVNATDYDWSTIGENIAAGQRTVTDVMEGWLESEGHCKNIMNDQFEHFGVSRADNEAADFQRYWTQVFGAER